jgi:hypothetical protein
VRKSFTGACLFLATFGIIGMLVLAELDAFFYGVPQKEPFIAMSDDHERIRVNLNISLYQIPCSAISLDY